jgi:hypothetical protein
MLKKEVEISGEVVPLIMKLFSVFSLGRTVYQKVW